MRQWLRSDAAAARCGSRVQEAQLVARIEAAVLRQLGADQEPHRYSRLYATRNTAASMRAARQLGADQECKRHSLKLVAQDLELILQRCIALAVELLQCALVEYDIRQCSIYSTRCVSLLCLLCLLWSYCSAVVE
jgi:hypothetical protein